MPKPTDEDRARLEGSGGGPFGPAERPMGGYLTIPAEVSEDEASDWVARACAHVAQLPPKQPRKR